MRNSPLHLLLLLALILTCLPPRQSGAQEAHHHGEQAVVPLAPAHEHHHHGDSAVAPPPKGPDTAPEVAPGGADVGLQERLGARIPLDAVFQDEGGHPVRLGEVVTGPTLILPVYYGCTNVCNYLQWGVAGVLPRMRAVPGQDYRVVSISFDETDSPLRASHARSMYLDAMKEPFPRDAWRFLTGDAAAIRSFTEAAGYHFQRRGQDIVHPVASFVVTKDGTIVRYLYGTSFLPKDLALAFVEAAAGKGGATIRKMVNYCFSFDPVSKSYEFNLLRVCATVVVLCTGLFLAYLIFGDRNRRRKGHPAKSAVNG